MNELSRADFLKLSKAALGALFLPNLELPTNGPDLPPDTMEKFKISKEEAERIEAEYAEKVAGVEQIIVPTTAECAEIVFLIINKARLDGLPSQESSKQITQDLNKVFAGEPEEPDLDYYHLLDEVIASEIERVEKAGEFFLQDPTPRTLHLYNNKVLSLIALIITEHINRTGDFFQTMEWKRTDRHFSVLSPNIIKKRTHENRAENKLLWHQLATIQPNEGKVDIQEDVFNKQIRHPQPEIVQFPLTDFNTLAVGDILTGHRSPYVDDVGEMRMIIGIQRNSQGQIQSIDICTGMHDQSPLGKVSKIKNLVELKTLEWSNATLMVVRTTTAHEAHQIEAAYYANVLDEDKIDPAIDAFLPGQMVDLTEVPVMKQIIERLKKATTQKERGELFQKLMGQMGLKIRLSNGDIVTPEKWYANPNQPEGFYACNLFSVVAAQLGAGHDVISHFIYEDEPVTPTNELPQKDELNAAGMHVWINRAGRQHGWAQIDALKPSEKKKLLAAGGLCYGANGYHTYVITGMESEDGEIVPVLSQATYDVPIGNVPSYRFQLVYTQGAMMGDLFARPMQGVPFDPEIFFTPLYGQIYNYPNYDGPLDENSRIEGFVDSVDGLRQRVNLPGATDKSWLKKVGEMFVPEDRLELKKNPLISYAVDLIRIIQNYHLPIGTPIEEDAQKFRAHIFDEMKKLGYGKYFDTQNGRAVLDKVENWFETRESVMRTNKKIVEPLQCGVLVDLLSLATDLPHVPIMMGGLGEGGAYEIAGKLLDKPRHEGGTFFDTKSTVIHFPKDLPEIANLQGGDSFYLRYSNTGHVGVILRDPILDSKGELVVLVADANLSSGVADGMPRIRWMTQQNFVDEYINLKPELPGKCVVLRPTA